MEKLIEWTQKQWASEYSSDAGMSFKNLGMKNPFFNNVVLDEILVRLSLDDLDKLKNVSDFFLFNVDKFMTNKVITEATFMDQNQVALMSQAEKVVKSIIIKESFEGDATLQAVQLKLGFHVVSLCCKYCELNATQLFHHITQMTNLNRICLMHCHLTGQNPTWDGTAHLNLKNFDLYKCTYFEGKLGIQTIAQYLPNLVKCSFSGICPVGPQSDEDIVWNISKLKFESLPMHNSWSPFTELVNVSLPRLTCFKLYSSSRRLIAVKNGLIQFLDKVSSSLEKLIVQNPYTYGLVNLGQLDGSVPLTHLKIFRSNCFYSYSAPDDIFNVRIEALSERQPEPIHSDSDVSSDYSYNDSESDYEWDAV